MLKRPLAISVSGHRGGACRQPLTAISCASVWLCAAVGGPDVLSPPIQRAAPDYASFA